MRRVSLLTALNARFTASNPSRQADYRAATLNQPKERPLELTWRWAGASLSYGDATIPGQPPRRATRAEHRLQTTSQHGHQATGQKRMSKLQHGRLLKIGTWNMQRLSKMQLQLVDLLGYDLLGLTETWEWEWETVGVGGTQP